MTRQDMKQDMISLLCDTLSPTVEIQCPETKQQAA